MGSLLLRLYPGRIIKIVFDGGQCNDLKDRVKVSFGETMKLKKDYVLTLSTFNVSEDGVIRLMMKRMGASFCDHNHS
jgi:hypothetical protein